MWDGSEGAGGFEFSVDRKCHLLLRMPAKGSLASYCIRIIMSGMPRPGWYVALGGSDGPRLCIAAGSLTSENGSCTFTLVLRKNEERQK